MFICCRHILAICHFNSNLKRDERTNESGKPQVKVVNPKFKNGEATVRSVRVLPEFGKSLAIYISMIVEIWYGKKTLFLHNPNVPLAGHCHAHKLQLNIL